MAMPAAFGQGREQLHWGYLAPYGSFSTGLGGQWATPHILPSAGSDAHMRIGPLSISYVYKVPIAAPPHIGLAYGGAVPVLQNGYPYNMQRLQLAMGSQGENVEDPWGHGEPHLRFDGPAGEDAAGEASAMRGPRCGDGATQVIGMGCWDHLTNAGSARHENCCASDMGLISAELSGQSTLVGQDDQEAEESVKAATKQRGLGDAQQQAKGRPKMVKGSRKAFHPAARTAKNVAKACVHCKKAHLACDEERPCRRCVHLNKTDCVDVEHKKRGRPRLAKEPKVAARKAVGDVYAGGIDVPMDRAIEGEQQMPHLCGPTHQEPG
nr:hypothetical protein HK105_005833 [Polyrhizophydium stewartii]